MSDITNPSLKNRVRNHFSALGDDAPTWTEVHGLLCALALSPSETKKSAEDALDLTIPDDVQSAMQQLQERLHTQLLAGEEINLPCLLDPYQEDDGKDLASWCAGFIAGVLTDEEAWHQDDEDTIAELLLPFFLISGLDDDPELDALWENTQVVRQMALAIPGLLEELFLLYHGEEQGTD